MNRRSFVKSAALTPLALGSFNALAAAVTSAPDTAFAPKSTGQQRPAAALHGESPMGDRFELTLGRVLRGQSPAYGEEFLLADVRPVAGRRFTEYSGDVSGRYIGALATAARVYHRQFPQLDALVTKVLALQKPDGYFGSSFHYEHPGDLDMALLWGNGRLLVGLLEYYRLKPSPSLLASCVRLGNFLLRVAPVMLSPAIRASFGAQHFASSYICWTQQTEGLANLYELTHDQRFRSLAEQIAAVTERRPSDHVHGYLTSLRGWVDLYRATDDAGILARCEAAWQDVAQSQDLLITGGVPEGWSPNNHRTEGCAEVDWLRLSLALANATGKTKYLAMAERTAFNEFSFNQFATGDFGHRVYTETGLPAAGAVRAWWCCTLHGLRCFPDLQASAFREGENAVDFNLPFDASFQSGRFSAISTSTLAEDGMVKIAVTGALADKPVQVRIRKPEWSENLTIRINKKVVPCVFESGYAMVNRTWKVGDVVEIRYAMALRHEAASSNRASFWFGPWLLGAPAAENPAYFNELTAENKLLRQSASSPGPSRAHFAVPVAAATFPFIPAEFPEQPSTVTLRPIAEQAGQPVTSWELRFLTEVTL